MGLRHPSHTTGQEALTGSVIIGNRGAAHILMLAAVECRSQLWTVLHDPPVDRRVIDCDPAFFHEFCDVACAQQVGQIPEDSHQNS